MSEMEIREYAKDKGFHPQTLERWLSWDQPARDTLFRLAMGLKVGENHLRDLMDWLEEIALRDQSTIEDSIRARIQELKLYPEIRLTVPPGLEGGRLRMELSASTPEELKRLTGK